MIPAPRPDIDSAPYWDALRAHTLVLRVCAACGKQRFPPTARCPYCADPASSWEEVPASGRVYAAITVHRTLDTAFTGDTPYGVVTVDLDGGARLLARADPGLGIGERVAGVYVDHPDWTELRFARDR